MGLPRHGKMNSVQKWKVLSGAYPKWRKKSRQVNQANIDYAFFVNHHFNKVNFPTKDIEPRSKVVAGLNS